MSRRHVVTMLSGGGPEGEWTCARALLDTISAQIMFFGEVFACVSPELAEKKGTNADVGEAAEIREGLGLGTVLEGEYAAGIAVDRFT